MPVSRRRRRLEAMHRFNKRVLNPVMRTVAGRRIRYASALHHVGRRSGKPHLTPVVAAAAAGGFVVPLPYGARVDWLRDIQAAGQATIAVHGQRFTLTGFRVISADEALPMVRADLRRLWRRLGIEEYLYAAASPVV
ncbi:nitroreductase/quinone reductase family protein [Actinoplanes sp. NPDC049802]|uniref:nitroreductase/quinone reductase family protein n=1 Tax=Actinoplanes sp. NPDC049802 TaxID=3154742 RepID=UPI00340AAB9A